MPRVNLSQPAETDLFDIWRTIAADSAANADHFIDRLLSTCEQTLAPHPEAGRRRDELALAFRSFPVGDYVIFYRIAADGIEIARILHGSRDFTALIE